MPATYCPRTGKVQFETLASAGRNAARRRLDGTEGNRSMAPYLCSCGQYHVGHSLRAQLRIERIVYRANHGEFITATELSQIGGVEFLKAQMEKVS